MQCKQLYKALPKATTINNKCLIVLIETVDDSSFHATTTRTSHKHHLAIIGSISEFLHQTLILKHSI